VLASFKSEGWTRRVGGPFDCALSMQAVQEALAAAGFTGVRIELRMDSLVLYAGER